MEEGRVLPAQEAREVGRCTPRALWVLRAGACALKPLARGKHWPLGPRPLLGEGGAQGARSQARCAEGPGPPSALCRLYLGTPAAAPGAAWGSEGHPLGVL